MKCINIIYNKEKEYQQNKEFKIVTIKKSVDQYYTKLMQKQKQKLQSMTELKLSRIDIRTSKSYRTRSHHFSQMTQSLNIAQIKTQRNPFHTIKLAESQNKNKTINNFSIKKKQKRLYSLKGLKDERYFQNIQKNIIKTCQIQKNHSKIKPLQRLKLVKQSTILISVQFILNQQNFWQQENIDQQAAKNWKYLQEFSNIIWLVKRQNTFKKLQKFCLDFSLRLDGVYQIVPNQKQKCLTLCLYPLQKQINLQNKNFKQKDTGTKIIIINSLRVDNLKHVQYQDFFNLLPITKTLPCIVHFIQIDIQDKLRFNSPLKILSKQVLPAPTKMDKIIQKFEKQCKIDQKQGKNKKQKKYNSSIVNMLERIQDLKQNYLRYFSQTLKFNPNQKIFVQNSQLSLQYLIGDMLKRNFNNLSQYQRQSRKIASKLKNQFQQQNNFENNQLKTSSCIVKKKLSYQNQAQKDNNLKQKYVKLKQTNNKTLYQYPVYLWKK